MKKPKLGILAFAVVASIGGAFASSPKSHNLNTYYAEQTSSGWTWLTSAPAHKSCQASSFAVSCTVEAATQPADNTMPPGQPITDQDYQ